MPPVGNSSHGEFNVSLWLIYKLKLVPIALFTFLFVLTFSMYLANTFEEVLHAFILVCHVITPIDTCSFKHDFSNGQLVISSQCFLQNKSGTIFMNLISKFLTFNASSLDEISVAIK
jgi:hypothetical protein